MKWSRICKQRLLSLLVFVFWQLCLSCAFLVFVLNSSNEYYGRDLIIYQYMYSKISAYFVSQRSLQLHSWLDTIIDLWCSWLLINLQYELFNVHKGGFKKIWVGIHDPSIFIFNFTFSYIISCYSAFFGRRTAWVFGRTPQEAILTPPKSLLSSLSFLTSRVMWRGTMWLFWLPRASLSAS